MLEVPRDHGDSFPEVREGCTTPLPRDQQRPPTITKERNPGVSPQIRHTFPFLPQTPLVPTVSPRFSFPPPRPGFPVLRDSNSEPERGHCRPARRGPAALVPTGASLGARGTCTRRGPTGAGPRWAGRRLGEGHAWAWPWAGPRAGPGPSGEEAKNCRRKSSAGCALG